MARREEIRGVPLNRHQAIVLGIQQVGRDLRPGPHDQRADALVQGVERPGLDDGHAAQVGAHAEEDEKLWILDALVVGLGVAQFR